MATYILIWSSFDPSIKYGSVKQLRKTPKTKKEQSCKIVVSNKTK